MALVSVPSGANSESANSSAWSPVYGGGAKLDSDTINYIHRIYCRECRMEEQRRKMEQEAAASGSGSTDKPTSPQNVVEEASIQQAMDQNKESLKRKLMLRRSVVELAEQGIYPPLKTPPAFNEERKKLELARNRDLLRQKIQQRPNRESLVQQHILEDSTADRSIQDRQRQLKRARLQDSLSDRLAHRPGPLELVEGNILQIDPNIKDALKDGTLHYLRASEDEDDSFVFDSAGSPSDTGSMSPQQQDAFESSGILTIKSKEGIPSPPDINPLVQKLKQQTQSTFGQSIPPITTKSFVPTPSSSLVSNGSSLTKNGQPQNSISSKLSKIKKNKPKSVPKAKVIKFHEYKGPPNLVKLQPPATSPTPTQNPPADGTPYNILLQQQQLFLQWQLEFQQKNLQLILPAGQKEGQPPATSTSQTSAVSQNSSSAPPLLSAPSPAPSVDSTSGYNSFINPPSVSPAPSLSASSSLSGVPSPIGSFQLQSVMSPPMAVLSPPPPPPMPPKIPTPVPQQPIQVKSPEPVIPTPPVVAAPRRTSTPAPLQVTKMPNFDEMKVADLKAELRKRTLTVSGTKSQLVERLKSAIEKDNANILALPNSTSTVVSSLLSFSEPLKSPPSVQSVASLGSLHSIPPFTPQSLTPNFPSSQQEEVVMTTGSPPVSPTNSATDLNASFTSTALGPVSPENIMDTSSQGPLFSIIVNQAAAQQLQNGSIPMSIDTVSRPPSVVPMDIDSANTAAVPNATDQNQNPQAPFVTVPLATLQKVTPAKTTVSNNVSKSSVPTTSQVKFQQKSPAKVTQSRKSTSKMKTSSSAPQPKPTAKVVQTPVQTNTVLPPMQVLTSPAQAFTTEVLLQQQQQQIDELKRQLLQSQQKLQEAERAQVTTKTQNKSKGSGSSKKKKVPTATLR